MEGMSFKSILTNVGLRTKWKSSIKEAKNFQIHFSHNTSHNAQIFGTQ